MYYANFNGNYLAAGRSFMSRSLLHRLRENPENAQGKP